MTRLRPRWAAVAGGWAAVLLVASVIDPSVADGGTTIPGGTAFFHVGGYAVLAVALSAAFRAGDPRRLLVAVAVATLYGAAIELLQGQLPYRTMSALDVGYNAAGAALGAALWWWRLPGGCCR